VSIVWLGLEDNIDTVYNISPDRLGLEDNIDTVYNISLDRLGLEDNIDTVYNIYCLLNPIYLEICYKQCQ
jgi:hypothetical protein